MAHEKPATLCDRQRLSGKHELRAGRGGNKLAQGKGGAAPGGERLGDVAICVVDDARRAGCRRGFALGDCARIAVGYSRCGRRNSGAKACRASTRSLEWLAVRRHA